MSNEMFFGVTVREEDAIVHIKPPFALTRVGERYRFRARLGQRPLDLQHTRMVFYYKPLWLPNSYNGQPVRFQAAPGTKAWI